MGLAAVGITGLADSLASAQVTRAFTRRVFSNLQGDFALVGNTSLQCSTTIGPTALCLSQRNAPGSTLQNNHVYMEFVDVDSDPTTFNSSSANFTLRPGTTVVWAGLYWQASLAGGTAGSGIPAGRPPPAPTARNRVLLRTPTSGTYRQVVSTQSDAFPRDGGYGEFAEVTSLVQQGGGGTYTVANLQAGTGSLRWGGWALVIIVADPGEPLRSLTVFDGAAVLYQSALSLSVTGLTTPQVGAVRTRLGFVVGDGENGVNDEMRVNNVPITDPTRAANDVFNGSITRLGVRVTDRNVNYSNTLGWDIGYLQTQNVLANGQANARIDLRSISDGFFAQAVVFATELYQTDLVVAKTVTDVNGGSPVPGDTLLYSVSVTNAGGDPAANVEVIDTLPGNTTYAPGSLVIARGANAGVKTDAAGDDPAELDAAGGRVVFRLGAGAGSAQGRGGVLNPGETEIVQFRVVVDPATPHGTLISNQARVLWNEQTLGTAHNTPSDGDLIEPGPQPTVVEVVIGADVEVAKSGPEQVVVGDGVEYTLRVTNRGPAVAHDVVVTDTLPEGITFLEAPGGGVLTGRVVTFPAIAALEPGQSVVFTVRGRGDVPGAWTNVAASTSTTRDPDPANNDGSGTGRVTTEVSEPQADLLVTKTGPTEAEADRDVTYIIEVRNLGPGEALNVVVSDTLDLAGAFRAASRGGTSTRSGSREVITWPVLPVLAPGAVETFTFTVHTPATGGVIVDIAAAASETADPNPVNNNGSAPTSRVTTLVLAPADLAVRKRGPPEVNADETFDYVVEVTNEGPGVASDVVVSDTLPEQVVFVGASGGGTLDGRVVTWTLADSLFPGNTRTFVLTVRAPPVPAADTLLDVAAAASPRTDPDPGDNDGSSDESRVRTIVRPFTNLRVAKAGPPSVGVGGLITWTVTVENLGGAPAHDVEVTDELPPGVTFVSATGDASTSGNLVVWPIPVLHPGQASVLTVTVRAPGSPGTVVNLASIRSPTPDVDPGDDRATSITEVVPAADLAVTKTGPFSAHGGTLVAYQVRVDNLGPSTAADVVMTDTLPAGATFVSATGGATLSGNVLTWPVIPSLAPGTGQAFVVTLTAPPVEGTLINAFAATSPTVDPNPENNRAVASTAIPPVVADVSIVKDGPEAVPAGGTITYVLTVANAGPSPAADVGVTDTLPAGVTFVSASEGGTLNGNVVGWPAIPSLAPGQQRSFTLVAMAGEEGTTLTDVAAAVSTTTDPAPFNNRATLGTVITPSADLGVVKTGPASASAGETVTYTLTATNRGPSTATNVIVTDTLPAGVTFVSASDGGTLSGSVVAWPAIASLASGGSASFTLQVTAPAAGGTFADAAAVTGDEEDPNPGDNRAVVTTTAAALADLSVRKTGPAAVAAGDQLTYTITVSDAGPSAAADVVVTDTLPAGVTFVSASDGGTLSGNVVTWPAIPSLDAGATQSYTLVVQAPDEPGTITNVAVVASPTGDPDEADDTATATTPVTARADLGITKTGPASANAGETVTYTLTANNAGPSTATNVIVTDTLPAGVTFVSAPDGGTLSGTVVTWPAIPSLPSGGSVSFTLQVTAPAAGGAFTDVAAVTGAEEDPNPGNNRVALTTSAAALADLSVSKTGPSTVAAGGSAHLHHHRLRRGSVRRGGRGGHGHAAGRRHLRQRVGWWDALRQRRHLARDPLARCGGDAELHAGGAGAGRAWDDHEHRGRGLADRRP